MFEVRNKKLDISADISSKYRISVGIDTILPTEIRLAKNWKNRRYFGEILEILYISAKYREYISRARVLEFLKKYW